MSSTVEKMEFKAELKQLLHLITHSLYSHKEIFLRELISNASDAINKIKFDSLDKEELLEGNKDWKIKLIPNKESGTLTISDNGIGMSRDTIIDNLGTIAKSGTRAFMEAARQQEGKVKPELIGQFGVGFYSAFMVADRVTVISRMPGDPKNGVKWESEGQGEYSLESVEKPTRGTDVILHLKEDSKEFIDVWQLRSLIRKFSDFIEHPIAMDIEKEDEQKNKTVEEEIINSRKAIWLRSKNEITPEEYNGFYKQISNDSEDPLRVIHYTAEGFNEFRVLMFIPAKKPFYYEWEEPKGLKLYIQRVLIMDSCEGLLPGYLRFVRGVVDSSDLPLNISREILQQNPLLEKMQKNIVRNVLENLEAVKNVDYDKYVSFFEEFGLYLKRGLGEDRNNKEKLADLMLFESTKTGKGKFTTLSDYVKSMPANQEAIYYLIGESREVIEHSPLLESYREKGQEVLLLTDPMDEFAIPSLWEYQGKKLQAVDRADAVSTPKVEGEEQYEPLFIYLKSKIAEVSNIRLSSRLRESASCLVADTHGMTAHYERLMKRMGRSEVEEVKRVLELNGNHPVVQALKNLHAQNADDPRIEQFGRLLYEQAVIAEGSKIKDPTGFAKRLNLLMESQLK
jgi:molecular chaperone HtpG